MIKKQKGGIVNPETLKRISNKPYYLNKAIIKFCMAIIKEDENITRTPNVMLVNKDILSIMQNHLKPKK